MKTSIQIAIIIFFTTIFSCNNQEKSTKLSKPEIEFVVLNEEISDTKIKTQVSQDLLVNPEKINEKKLLKLLNYSHKKIRQRTGFKHNEHPNSIWIYVYASKEHYKSKMGQWIARSGMTTKEKKAKTEFKLEILDALLAPDEERFGLSEKERKEIWTTSITAGDRANKEAEQKYPIDGSDPNYKDSNIDKNMALSKTLSNKYKNELLKKYNISDSVLKAISNEGVKKSWPFPEY